MKIKSIRINGLKNPVGYMLGIPSVSWIHDGAPDGSDDAESVEISEEPGFGKLLYRMSGSEVQSRGTPLRMTMKPRTRYYVRIRMKDKNDGAVSETAFFETGKMNELFEGGWIAAARGDRCNPFFSTKLFLDREPVSSRIYITAAGVYELYVNGKRVGDEYLAPGFCDYASFLQLYTYLPELHAGENTVSILAGGGWCCGRFGPEPREGLFSPFIAVTAEIRAKFEDGSEFVTGTDGGWKYCRSDIVYSGIYDGEIIERGSGEGDEKPVRTVTSEDGRFFDGTNLRDRLSPPLKVTERIKPTALIRTARGETVLDMGQNFAGYLEYSGRLSAGERIHFDYGELLQDGSFYNGNYRTARAEFEYYSDGRAETVRPHFTYFGFRYVRISGINEPDIGDFTGCVVHSEMDMTGSVITGNPKVNRLIENCLWSMKSNFFDMPTDCPQRDERLGWTGDAQIFAPAACYFADTRAFFGKYLYELRQAQKKLCGGVPNYLPDFDCASGVCSVWGDAAVLIPDTLYRRYGDKAALEKFYPLMKDWVDYLMKADNASGGKNLITEGFQFGDWLAQDGVTESSMKGGTDDYFIASAYYMHSAELVAEAAGILDKKKDKKLYSELSCRIRRAMLREYFTPEGRLSEDSQTALLLALRFVIYRNRARLIAQLRSRIRRDCFRIRGGFVGAPGMCSVLASQGLSGLAYDFLLSEDYPSWLYCVNLGATTVWERWNSVLPDGRISGEKMNSLNHYAYGAVVEFIFAYAAGIRPLTPGFGSAIIAPLPDIRLGSLRAEYRSVSGCYRSEWIINGDGSLSVSVSVPYDCSAELILPGKAGEVQKIGCGSYHYDYIPDADYRRIYNADTPLSAVARDRRAVRILRENVPSFADFITCGDPELSSLTVGGLGSMHFIPHDARALHRAQEQICGLLYERDSVIPGKNP